MAGSKISVGARNIRVSDDSSAAALGRGLAAAFSEISDNLQWFCDQLDGYLPQDLEDALQPTFELSQVYVPRLTNALAESGYIATESFRGGARVEIGYGKGGIPDYAIYVHEMPYHHAAPTKDHFLLDALNEDYFNIIQRVTDNVKARVGG